jgi:hypothetical protein
MTYKGLMAKKKQNDIVDEILDEIESDRENSGPVEKRAYYADFPKGLYADFEEVVKPWKPTRAFVRYMQKMVERAKGKKK